MRVQLCIYNMSTVYVCTSTYICTTLPYFTSSIFVELFQEVFGLRLQCCSQCGELYSSDEGRVSHKLLHMAYQREEVSVHQVLQQTSFSSDFDNLGTVVVDDVTR